MGNAPERRPTFRSTKDGALAVREFQETLKQLFSSCVTAENRRDDWILNHHRQSRTQCGPAKILTMINIPIPKPINPREPEMILPSQIGDTLFLPSPEAVSRNLLHVTALYKKAIPTKQQESPAAQIKNSVFPPAEGAPGMTTE